MIPDGHLCVVLAMLLMTGVLVSAKKFNIPDESKEKENSFWYDLGRDDIDIALNRKIINSPAKNVILFLGDGMGITVTTAARIFKGQHKGQSGEEESLVWEKFPNVALSKTYNLDKQVPDSAATATAFLTGVKGNYYTLGVNGKVKNKDCAASLLEDNRTPSILKWSQDAGKDTGFVTNTRVTHATPAALYAHSAERYWECDTKLDEEPNTERCKDIARQLVEDAPGKDANVIFAGGRLYMGAPLSTEKPSSCTRTDGRNLVAEWQTMKEKEGHAYKYVTDNQSLRELDVDKLDYIMGLFGDFHMPYSYERNDGPEGTPSLKEMTEVAIKRLQRNPNGFFLMVEGGRIDHGLHDTRVHASLEEVLAFDEAVEAALEMTDDEETLIIVTADHSHVMTMNGYPDRGNDILGKTFYEDVTDGMEYTTLMFTTGNATNFTWNGEEVMRPNLTGVDTRDFDFMFQSLVPTKFGYETHGGEDVGIYATGPMSHLFHTVHEQSYVAHVMGYASCVGMYADDCPRDVEPPTSSASTKSGSTPLTGTTVSLIVAILVAIKSVVRSG